MGVNCVLDKEFKIHYNMNSTFWMIKLTLYSREQPINCSLQAVSFVYKQITITHYIFKSKRVKVKCDNGM